MWLQFYDGSAENKDPTCDHSLLAFGLPGPEWLTSTPWLQRSQGLKEGGGGGVAYAIEKRFPISE